MKTRHIITILVLALSFFFSGCGKHPEITVNHVKESLVGKLIPNLNWFEIKYADLKIIRILDAKYEKDNAIVYVFAEICEKHALGYFGYKGEFRLSYEWAEKWNLLKISVQKSQKLTKKEYNFYKYLDSIKNYPLHYSAAMGDLDAVKSLIKDGKSIHKIEDRSGTQPLGFASYKGHDGVADYLISKGADVNYQDKNGFNALMSTALNGNSSTAKILIDAGADVNAKNIKGRTPLIFASMLNGNIETVNVLLDNNADVNAITNKGVNALVPAAVNFKNEILKKLIEKGANIKAQDKSEYTPLFYAVKKLNAQGVDILISAGADVNIKIQHGFTPLLALARIEKDKLVNKKDKYVQIAKLLIAAGAEVNAKTIDGYTPLLFVLWNYNYDLVEILISAGADVNAKTQKGDTALTLTKRNKKITNLLRKHGAK